MVKSHLRILKNKMTEKLTNQQYFDEIFANLKKETEDWKKEINEIYNPDMMRQIHGFMNGSGSTSLENLCNPQTADFLFNNGGCPLIQKDEPSMTRKQKYFDKNLFCSYYFQDPTDNEDFKPHTNVDIIAVRKKIPSQLKNTLEDLGYFSDTLIDFEAFEFPHFMNESYYGIECSEAVKEICKNINLKNKDIAKEFRKGHSPLYRDTEKIHLQFAAGGNKNGEVRMLPVYIGIGTNEPFGLTFNGEFGKSRFRKFKFDSEDSGIERGELEEAPLSPEQFRKRFPGVTLYDIAYGKNWIIYTMKDERPSDKYERFKTVTFDEDRFKGFIKIHMDGKRQTEGFLVTPRFSHTRVPQTDYLRAIINKTSLSGIQTIGNSKQILGLLDGAMKDYENFSAVQLDPEHIVKKFGMETVYKTVSSKLDGGQFAYADSTNIASDVYNISSFSWERLRVASLIVGNYIHSGKFDELLKNTYLGKNTQPL